MSLPGRRWRCIAQAGCQIRGAEACRRDGCGRYDARQDGSIRIEEILSTLIGGAEAEETGRYLAWMQQAAGFEVSASALRLHLPGDGFLHFRREPAS